MLCYKSSLEDILRVSL